MGFIGETLAGLLLGRSFRALDDGRHIVLREQGSNSLPRCNRGVRGRYDEGRTQEDSRSYKPSGRKISD